MGHIWAWSLTVSLCVALVFAMDAAAQPQRAFGLGHTSHESGWRVSISDAWDVLGPFPIHAREQHFLSPSFPLNLSQPLDLEAKWPSAYADGGEIEWTTARSKTDGTLDVSFPEIRWAALRATEGWASLQHHSVLRTTITVTPPSVLSDDAADQLAEFPRLLVDVMRGSFFTVLPPKDSPLHSVTDFVPRWYMGNIYGMERVLPQTVPLPSAPSLNGPTTYELIVSGDYEIRLFGDPRFSGDKTGVPTLSIKLSVDLEPVPAEDTVEIVPGHGVACDFVDGWAFGDAFGVGVRSVSGWWTVNSVSLATPDLADQLNITLLQNTTLAPTQARIVPIKLFQLLPFGGHEIPVELHLESKGTDAVTRTLYTSITVRQHPHWSPSEIPEAGIQATYFYSGSTPTAFLVKPPEEPNEGPPRIPVLALHGAGVDIFSMPFWIQAIPRQKHSWIVTPSGRTAWGLDWHGPSAMDAWGSVDALSEILKSRDAWRDYEFPKDTRVLLIGHSNGGQGAWWNAGRYPDRVAAVIPAAGYLKSQAYVPLIQSHSAHYVDPSLRAILETALTPDDNDLFLSNLAHTPILAIHGGDDENVPTWHSRAYISTLKTWNPNASVALREDPGELHWYTGMFDNPDVREYMRTILESDTGLATTSVLTETPDSFTLTVSIPAESGSLHGWRVHQLLVPGRLGRLTVRVTGASIDVRTGNIAAFSIRHVVRYAASTLIVDGTVLPSGNLQDDLVYFSYQDGIWRPTDDNSPPALQPYGRLATILTSTAPLTIVYEPNSPSLLSAALRLAAALDGYHKLDAEIISDEEATRRLHANSLGDRNVVVLTTGTGEFTHSLLSKRRTAFSLEGDSLRLKGKPLSGQSAALFLHPHPSAPDASILFIHALEESALERGLRLFPVRTGVPVPDLIVITERADEMGAGGIEGAGVWGNAWSWNEGVSSFYIIKP